MEAIPPLPDTEDDESREFWEAAARGEFRVQACGDCGKLRFPPRPMCPACQSIACEWRELSGGGSVWSFVVVHPPVLPAYADLAPYPVVVVALDEDPTLRMVGNVVSAPQSAINSVDPASIAIGDPVRVCFAEIDGVPMPRWVHAKAAS
jgi:uncharacterized OB-fold protein